MDMFVIWCNIHPMKIVITVTDIVLVRRLKVDVAYKTIIKLFLSFILKAPRTASGLIQALSV